MTTHNAHLLIVMMLPDRAKELGRVKKDPPGGGGAWWTLVPSSGRVSRIDCVVAGAEGPLN